jgi:hypothetical protein
MQRSGGCRIRHLSFLTGTFEFDGRIYSGDGCGGARRRRFRCSRACEASRRERRMDGNHADRWRRLRPLLERAIDLEGSARQAYLDGLRGGGGEEFRGEIEQLLAQHDELKERTSATAMALVTLALSRDEQNNDFDDRSGLSHSGAYPRREFGAEDRGDVDTASCWFVADSGPDSTK